MGALATVEALETLKQQPINSFAATRKQCLPFVEFRETVLAETEDEVLEIAEGLKEEPSPILPEPTKSLRSIWLRFEGDGQEYFAPSCS